MHSPPPSVDSRDRRILYATGFVRAVTTGLVGILIGVYLARLELTPARIGGVVTAGLMGATAAATLATFAADRIGRRRFLLGVAALSAVGTLLFALVSNPAVLGLAAFVGMLNGMGRDRGAGLVLEQALLPSTTTDAERTRTIALYTMLQDFGHAAGSLLAGVPTLLSRATPLQRTTPQRATLIACAIATMLIVLLYGRLSKSVELDRARRITPVSPRTRGILIRISSLFAIDGLASGFLTTAMLSYFFFERFGVNEAVIGGLFFGARVMNALSHLAAAWLAKRIGLVNTMVFTHLPSSLLLVTVAFAPTFPIAAILFLLREGLVEMDVPTRQSYVFALVAPEERTLASGATNLVRLGAWGVAPVVAGAVTNEASLFLPLVIGAAIKIGYDVLLYLAFRRLKPPEERDWPARHP